MISPRISKSFTKSFLIDKGIERIVFILLVTSSPWKPSPLVTAFINWPFSYVKLIDAPSNFNSHVYSISEVPNIFWILFSQSNKSSFEYELSKEYILFWCTTVLKFLVMLPPTLCVGEFTSKKIGFSFSNFSNSLSFISKSKSEIVALSNT